MNKILATPTSLIIGEHELPLVGQIEFQAGSYRTGRPPLELYHKAAEAMARQRGIAFDALSANDTHYFFTREDEPFNLDTTAQIPQSVVRETLPNYVKFLRIIPEATTDDWHSRVLKPLEERITALACDGLQAFIPTILAGGRRESVHEVHPFGVELALVAGYHITVTF